MTAAVIVAVGLATLVLRQCRKPWSWPGRGFIWMMDRTHLSVTEWGLRQVQLAPAGRVLDVGCGGGRTTQTLANAGNLAFGIDYSSASVAAARSRNAALIAENRVALCRASVSQLPFAESSFALVTAIETHYYWPDLHNDLREISRVLSPGGTLVIIAETYRDHKLSAALVAPMFLLGARYLTVEEHQTALHAAGFVDVNIDVDARKGWICARACRPTA